MNRIKKIKKPCSYLEHPQLSLEAKGLFRFILMNHSEGKISINFLTEELADEDLRIYQAIEELKKFGYVENFSGDRTILLLKQEQ